MLSSRPMEPILNHSHEGQDSDNQNVVHLSTQAGKMRLRESDAAPGYEVVTPQDSPPRQDEEGKAGTTSGILAAPRAAGLGAQRITLPGGGSELANAESLGGASQAAHTARLANIGGGGSQADIPSPSQRPTSAGGMASSGADRRVSLGRLASGYSPAQAVGPGATGLASARGLDNVDGAPGTPSQFVFPKLGARRMSEAGAGAGIHQSGHVSPPNEPSGISTPENEKAGSSGKQKKKEHHHHNPLVDLRRVSLE